MSVIGKHGDMSGRLIITTKKSYCPWGASNVERVLRDERLERERLERQQQSEENQSSKQRHHLEDVEPQGHINLFPEAREAEIRLTHGTTNDVEKKNCSGILPLPLGGDELNDRKKGKVPFYLKTQSQQEEKYDNSSYLGIRGNRSGKAPSDEITGNIMRDQFASREENRKQKNDPMSRFYVDSTDAALNIYANKESLPIAEYDLQSNCRVASSQVMDSQESKSQEGGRTISRKRKYNLAEGAHDHAGDESEVSSASSSSSISSSPSSSSSWDSRRHESRRKHHYKKNKRSKHSSSSRRHHRRKNSPHHEKKRRKERRRKRKRRSKDQGEDDRDRQKIHHDSSLQSFNPPSNKDMEEPTKSDAQQLDIMRRRRHAREAREMERQRQIK